MVLLAVYGLVLARWSGSADLLVGTPVIGRPRRELEHLIGFFANTLVMRVNLGRDLTFRELVRQVRETAIHAFAHQDMPFERIVEELQPERTLGHNPLFQVMFALRRPNEMGPAQPGGARAEAPPSSSGAEPSSVRPNTSKFDLTLFMIEDTSFYGAIEYRTDIFDAATIERFANHMLSAARAVVTAPDRALSSAWSATESDLALIETWNRTTATFADAEVRVSALCAAQAARSPERPAVSSRTQVLSYRELWGQASRLAAHLRALGIGPDTRVALCIEPSVALVVAVFGILEAGGACVPLDASYPPERLQYMVQNSGVRLLVTTSTAPNVALGLERVLIDGELESPGAPPPPQAFSCDQLAYIVYTSGSTGMPKGVAMTHRALVNLVLWQLGSKGRGEARRTLQFASPSFDVFFQELALCAAAGGELVIAPPHERRDPAQLRKLCRERQIERLFLPFVALRELMDTGDEPASMPHLREVITAGEQLQVTPALRRWFSAHPNCRLYNQYGPSETHVVSEEALPADPALWSPLPPIGRPIANARLYVLDASLQPLPVGVPGDLYLGGVCLARGYLDKVDLTAARFLPDPFSPLPGARMYASGDRARWRPDGRVEFLGRKDDQIKVRGYRVELGEVEAALSRLPGVGHAVAAALPDARGDKRLVGYILPDGAKLDPSALRDALRRMLPEPLVPSILVLVDHLPRTPSGKVDRRALPAPPREGGATREPRNEIERVIAGIWCEVLGLTRVGVDDDFFELGGHSLMATQVVARLRDVLAIDLPVSRLFEYPTIARLAPAVAAALLTQDGEPDASELASIEELTEDEARRLFAAEYTGGLHG
jgi:amino acid adenylation domain-containing protein